MLFFTEEKRKSLVSNSSFRIMTPVIGIRFYSLVLVFSLCFTSFLGGWLTAVFILPGKKSLQVHSPEIKNENKELYTNSSAKDSIRQKKIIDEKKTSKVPFLKEMKDNIMFLFDPYKMDSIMKKNTYLELKDSPIKKQTDLQIPLKIQATDLKKPTSFQKKNSEKQNTYLRNPFPEEYNSTENYLKKENSVSSTLQKIQKEYDKKNRKQLMEISGNQKFFKINGNFSFLVNVFSEQTEALNYVKSMKEIYPSWSFLLKAHIDHIRIYLGPFQTKEKALEFQKIIPSPSPFSQLFLEEVSL